MKVQVWDIWVGRGKMVKGTGFDFEFINKAETNGYLIGLLYLKKLHNLFYYGRDLTVKHSNPVPSSDQSLRSKPLTSVLSKQSLTSEGYSSASENSEMNEVKRLTFNCWLPKINTIRRKWSWIGKHELGLPFKTVSCFVGSAVQLNNRITSSFIYCVAILWTISLRHKFFLKYLMVFM